MPCRECDRNREALVDAQAELTEAEMCREFLELTQTEKMLKRRCESLEEQLANANDRLRKMRMSNA